MENGIKSKQRVQEHGEVFTPDSIVNDMLDLVDKELNKDNIWEYIDKTYLEPSCGNGNFLIRILDRKLQVVQKLPKEQWELGLLHSLSTIYAVDIQGDNVEESKERLIELIKNGSVDVLELQDKEKKPFHFEKYELTNELERVIKFILDLNIQQGNTLTGKKWDGQTETNEDMLITEYIWNNNNVKRREILFNNLIKEGNINYDATENEYDEVDYMQLGLNSDKNEGTSEGISEDDEYDF